MFQNSAAAPLLTVPKLCTEVSILIDSASHWLSRRPSRWPPSRRQAVVLLYVLREAGYFIRIIIQTNIVKAI